MNRRKVWTTGITMLAMVAAVMILAWIPGCKGPYDAAWRTLDSIQKAKALTAQQLAQAARLKHADCKKLHGVKNAAFANCIADHRKALKTWQDDARPAINSAVQITATALQIAEQVKAEKKVDWMTLLKPAVCALMRVARAWGHYFPDKGKTVLGALQGLEGVLCGD